MSTSDYQFSTINYQLICLPLSFAPATASNA